jgi:L,D-peptidoglycan transpeptidase YkuD (ErfK/YbiS/YcfS/YnhG family)
MNTSHPSVPRVFAIALIALLLICTSSFASELPWKDARQLVLVVTADWDANQGTMSSYERVTNTWKKRGEPVAVAIGRSGSAWGTGLNSRQEAGPVKKEGDGRSPAGVFRIGDAFGYSDVARTGLHYRAMRESDYCIDVSGSPLYNQIVDANKVGQAAVEKSTEPMRRDLHANGDHRYKLGFVIEHNASAQADGGSCIFAHLWKQPGEPTAGCTAMDEKVMRDLIGWLRTDQHPVFVLLPETQYQRLKADWDLP